jgi:hypothetical protein
MEVGVLQCLNGFAGSAVAAGICACWLFAQQITTHGHSQSQSAVTFSTIEQKRMRNSALLLAVEQSLFHRFLPNNRLKGILHAVNLLTKDEKAHRRFQGI